MGFEDDFSQFKNVIPIGRGHEIRQEKMQKFLAIESEFMQKVGAYNTQNKNAEIPSSWIDDIRRLTRLLYLKPEEINSAREELIQDLIEGAEGSANFLESIHAQERSDVYKKGGEILSEAWRNFQENRGNQ